MDIPFTYEICIETDLSSVRSQPKAQPNGELKRVYRKLLDVDSRRGVTIDGAWYWHPRFARARPKERVAAHAWSSTMHLASVCFRGKWLLAGLRDENAMSYRSDEVAQLLRHREWFDAQMAMLRRMSSDVRYGDRDFHERCEALASTRCRLQMHFDEQRRELLEALRQKPQALAAREEFCVQDLIQMGAERID